MAVPNVMMLFALRKEITAPIRSEKRRTSREIGCFSAKNRYNKENGMENAPKGACPIRKEEVL